MSLGQWGDPWQPRPAPRAVIVTLNLTDHHPPSPAFNGAKYRPQDTRIRVNGRQVGRVVSAVTVLDQGRAEALAIVDLTDAELDQAFPHGWILDPDTEGAP